MALTVTFFTLVGLTLVGISALLAVEGAATVTSRGLVYRAIGSFWLLSAIIIGCLWAARHWVPSPPALRENFLTALPTLLWLGVAGFAFRYLRWRAVTVLGLQPERAPRPTLSGALIEALLVAIGGGVVVLGLLPQMQ
ncbi:MAG TPA: hypothetical protein EYP85_00150 [Armatimonadetes bacterium]|nr:hypothetical protein [Armatimonadota bacterium]